MTFYISILKEEEKTSRCCTPPSPTFASLSGESCESCGNASSPLYLYISSTFNARFGVFCCLRFLVLPLLNYSVFKASGSRSRRSTSSLVLFGIVARPLFSTVGLILVLRIVLPFFPLVFCNSAWPTILSYSSLSCFFFSFVNFSFYSAFWFSYWDHRYYSVFMEVVSLYLSLSFWFMKSRLVFGMLLSLGFASSLITRSFLAYVLILSSFAWNFLRFSLICFWYAVSLTERRPWSRACTLIDLLTSCCLCRNCLVSPLPDSSLFTRVWYAVGYWGRWLANWLALGFAAPYEQIYLRSEPMNLFWTYLSTLYFWRWSFSPCLTCVPAYCRGDYFGSDFAESLLRYDSMDLKSRKQKSSCSREPSVGPRVRHLLDAASNWSCCLAVPPGERIWLIWTF